MEIDGYLETECSKKLKNQQPRNLNNDNLKFAKNVGMVRKLEIGTGREPSETGREPSETGREPSQTGGAPGQVCEKC